MSVPFNRIYHKAKQFIFVYNKPAFIIAEIDWTYSHEFDNSDYLEHIYVDYADRSIHQWVNKYHPLINNWLFDRNIEWRGVQTGDVESLFNASRGFMAVGIVLQDDTPLSYITEFKLTWC